MNLLAQLICAHLVGDFLLQNDWMQAKSRDFQVCLIHVLVYQIPFFILFQAIGQNYGLMFLAIYTEHFLQDRFALHLKWMKFYRQTPPTKWPVGPLCVDQAMHIGSIWLFASLAGVA